MPALQVHLNIRSISANREALYAYMSFLNRKLDAVCLSETCIRQLEFIEDLFFSYYTSFNSMQDKRGGEACSSVYP